MKLFWTEGRKIAYRVIVILAAVQIGLGVIWAVLNLGRVPCFQETRELLEISSTFVTDEYVGILYPVLIRIASMTESLLHIPYQYFLYLLQLGLGYYAIKRLLQDFKCPKTKLAVLWVMTIPIVLQLFLAVLPQALAVSALLLCISSCSRKEWIPGAAYWLLCGLLIPEYLWFAGFVWLLYFVIEALKKRVGRRTLLQGVVCIAAVCVISVAVNSAVREDYSRGRMLRTPVSMALSRVVWPHFYTNSYFWHGDVHALFDEDGLNELAQNPEYSVTMFGAAMEQTYGQEWAQVIYRNMTSVSWKIRTREILSDIANDLVGYTFPMPYLLRNLEGEGVSFAGWNYGQMSEKAPVLTSLYVQGCGRIFGLLAGIALLLLARKVLRRKPHTADRKLAAALGTVCVLQVLWYTASMSGSLDYRNVMTVCVGWGILAAFHILSCFADRDLEG